MRRAGLVLVVAVLTSIGARADRASFVEAWVGRTVTLAQPLYTMAVGRYSYGLATVTPDRGTFYQAHLDGNHNELAREPEELLAKTQALYGHHEEPRLLTFRAGSTLRVLRVTIAPIFERRMVVIGLADTLAPTTWVTDLRVVLPEPIDTAFTARPQVEALVAPFFVATP